MPDLALVLIAIVVVALAVIAWLSRAAIRRWWARQPQAFRAAAVTAWFSFLGTLALQAARIADDVVKWIDGGPEPVWLTAFRAVSSAAVTLVAFVLNLWYRSRRPAAYWAPPAGSPSPTPNPPEEG